MSNPLDEFADAPIEVQDAAAYVRRNTGRAFVWGSVFALVWFVAMFGGGDTGFLNWVGVAPWLLRGPFNLVSMVTLVGIGVWAATGPLKHWDANKQLLDRYRWLRTMGLQLRAPSESQAQARSAVDRLVERIHALTETEAVRSAAVAARARVVKLDTELEHLNEAVASDKSLESRLIGVRERVEAEIAGIRAQLAETYAALLELDLAEDGARPALDDSLGQIAAELEVAGTSDTTQRDAARRAQQAQQLK